MQRLEVSGAVRPIYGSLGVKRLIISYSAKAARSRERKKGLMGCDMSFTLFPTPPHPAWWSLS